MERTRPFAIKTYLEILSLPKTNLLQKILWWAGVYNILWGSMQVLFPKLQFELLQMPMPNYLEFWQCIGMIVAVYGLLYMFAAHDLNRYWPVVLVGFLGKVFGPIGFAQAIWLEKLPLSFGINIIFNDIIWWVPFYLLLRSLDRKPL